MNPDQPQPVHENRPLPYDPKEHVDNALKVTQTGETIICDIKRHPIGIISIYVMSGFLLLLVAVLVFGVAPHFNSDGSNTVTQIGAIVLLFLVIICAVYNFIATKIYWGNRWIVTSDSLTEVSQTSLFDRQSSQLSLGNLEDISAEQNGVLAHMFNYGIISAETAAATDKFTFLYCPNPNLHAQKILAAREAFEQGRRPLPQQPYGQQDAYTAAAMPPPPVQAPAPVVPPNPYVPPPATPTAYNPYQPSPPPVDSTLPPPDSSLPPPTPPTY